MTLFRPEANPHTRERLHGDVNVAMPISWQLVGGGIGCALVGALMFCCLGSFSRIETVPGIVTTDRGVVAVSPPRTGVLQEILVKNGEEVRPGQTLARISTEEMTPAGDSLQNRLMASIQEQKVRLESQRQHFTLASSADQSHFVATVHGLDSEIESLNEQIAVQQEIVASADDEYAQSASLAQSGFISKVDMQKRRQNMLVLKNELAQMIATRASKKAAAESAKQSALQSEATARAQIASLDASVSELKQHAINTDAARAFSISAAVAGRVTTLTARKGQIVSPQVSLMQIMPTGATLMAELHVPTYAAGSLAIGDKVALAVEAFPYQEFGSLNGHIADVAATTILKSDQKDLQVPVYLVTVAVPPDALRAFSASKSLLPGMTLTGRITTRKQRIISLILEPLRAIGDR